MMTTTQCPTHACPPRPFRLGNGLSTWFFSLSSPPGEILMLLISVGITTDQAPWTLQVSPCRILGPIPNAAHYPNADPSRAATRPSLEVGSPIQGSSGTSTLVNVKPSWTNQGSSRIVRLRASAQLLLLSMYSHHGRTWSRASNK